MNKIRKKNIIASHQVALLIPTQPLRKDNGTCWKSPDIVYSDQLQAGTVDPFPHKPNSL